jgi:hypothetical protein
VVTSALTLVATVRRLVIQSRILVILCLTPIFILYSAIHGSDAADSAKAEISLWFTEKEIINYTIEHSNKWVYEK